MLSRDIFILGTNISIQPISQVHVQVSQGCFTEVEKMLFIHTE